MGKRIGFVKRVIAAVESVCPPNWLAPVKAAVKAVARGTWRMSTKPTVRVEQSPTAIQIPVRPAFRLVTAPLIAMAVQKVAAKIVGRGSFLMPESPALDLVAAGEMKITEKPAMNVVQVDFQLEHKSFMEAVTNDTGNSVNWTNPANAQGANDGVLCAWTNPLTILSLGSKVHGTTVTQVSRPTSLVINSVWLALWGSYSGAIDILTHCQMGYRIGGITALDVVVFDRTTTGSDAGTEARVDNGAGAFTDTLSTAVTWANIGLLQFFANAICVVGVNPTFNIDAMRLRVVAQEVWAP